MAISVYRKSQWLFLSSQLITGIGDQLYNIAVAILVYQKTSSSFLLAITLSTSYIGVLIGYFITPYLKKRFSHTHIMRMTDFISAPLVSLIPFIPIFRIFLLIFFLGILRGINRPLSQELVPKISQNTEEIKKLNADFTTVQILSMLGGVILSGLFVAAEELKLILVIDGISFFACSWMTSYINLVNKVKEKNNFILQAKNEPFKSYLKIILHPIKSFQQETILFCLLIPNSLAFGLISSYQSQLFPLVNSYSSYKILYIIIEFVIAICIIYATYLMKQKYLLSKLNNLSIWLLAGFLCSCFYLFVLINSSLFFLFCFLALANFFDGLYTIAEMNVLFEKVEEKYLEYILSLRYLLRIFFKVILVMIVGFLIQFFSLKITLAGVSILFSIIMLSCHMVIREKSS